MSSRLLLASFLALAAGTGCATVGADGATDWYSIGARDGRLGAWPDAGYLQSRLRTPGDRELYIRGWDDGFAQRPGPAS
jgi:hypothetical protein